MSLVTLGPATDRRMSHIQAPRGLAEGSAASYRKKDPDIAPVHAADPRSKMYEQYAGMAVPK